MVLSPPDKELIKFLEQLLTAAKEGNITEVAVAYNYKGFFYQYDVGTVGAPHTMFGVLSDLALNYRENYLGYDSLPEEED